MKCQILFSEKNKKKIFKMSFAEIFTHHAKRLLNYNVTWEKSPYHLSPWRPRSTRVLAHYYQEQTLSPYKIGCILRNMLTNREGPNQTAWISMLIWAFALTFGIWTIFSFCAANRQHHKKKRIMTYINIEDPDQIVQQLNLARTFNVYCLQFTKLKK